MNRGGVLVALGISLVALGALLALVGEPRVTFVSDDVDFYLQRFEVKPPGDYYLNLTETLARSGGHFSLGEEPVELSLQLAPPPNTCVGLERWVTYGLEGPVTGGEAVVRVRLEAVLANGSRVALQDYEAKPEQPVSPTEEGMEETVALEARGLGVKPGQRVGYLKPRGSGGWELVIEPLRVALPPDARQARLTLETGLRGDVALVFSAGQLCRIRYHASQPFLAPAGQERVEVPTPIAVILKSQALRAGIALMGVGSVIAVLGVYVEARRCQRVPPTSTTQ